MKRRNFLGACIGALVAPLAIPADPSIYCAAKPACTPPKTKEELVALMKKAMRNTPPTNNQFNRTILNHIYISADALDDIRNWGVDQIDEQTRKEIMINGWESCKAK